MTYSFDKVQPKIDGNPLIRTPQREGFRALAIFAQQPPDDREAGIILPVGCGKSGLIALGLFAFKAKRTLVIAPGVRIAKQLAEDFNPSNPDMFYLKCKVLPGSGPFPEPVQISGMKVNIGDLEEADVVIANIQQLQGADNRWLAALPDDFFDLILFDEGHHSIAESYSNLKNKFRSARIVNFSATPVRADGQLMAGRVIYAFEIFRAIEEGFVKQLKAVQLNPRTLRYVEREGGQEVEISLDEVRQLAANDSKFRRGIVMSEPTLATIVDASIHQLRRLRSESGENRLKIIASALNYTHCNQIVQAYKSRGLRADYVHSEEEGDANKRVLDKLEAHELDVIVQVRMLGEGFDHKYLAVAAVCSVFQSLSPFVQFVGRVMRVIKQRSPNDPLNRGVVVFHTGANIASRWSDFQEFSGADQDFFDQLLPLEGLDPSDPDQREVDLFGRRSEAAVVKGQTGVQLEELPLLDDEMEAISLLQERGLLDEELRPVPITKVAARQAKRDGLDVQARTEAARVLKERGVNLKGKELDKSRRRENLIVMKSAIDRQVNAHVGRGSGERRDFSRTELDSVEGAFPEIVSRAIAEVFDGR